MASKGPKTGAAKPAATKNAAAPSKPVSKPAATQPTATKPAEAPAKPAPVAATVAKAEAPAPAPAKPEMPAPVAKPEPVAKAEPAPAPAAKPVPEVKPVAAAATAPKTAEVKSVKKPTVNQTKATPAPRTAATAKKETSIMETTIENNVNRAQAMIADMNDRAKSAMERNAKLVEEFNDFNKGNIEAVVESGRIAAKGIETMGQDAAEYSRKSFEQATAALKGLSQVKSPADFFKLQNDYVRQSFDAMVAETSKNTEAMMKLANDVAQPISNRFAVAAEKVKKVAA